MVRIVGLLLVALNAGCSGEQAVQDIQQKVAADTVKQYAMVERHGTDTEKCVHAGIVAASFLQAQDEQNYERWKMKEKVDCAVAGL